MKKAQRVQVARAVATISVVSTLRANELSPNLGDGRAGQAAAVLG